MATTSVRWVAAKKLIELLQALPAASSVDVQQWWPGDLNMSDEMIWLDDISSTVGIPVMSGTRQMRDDKFSISLLYRVIGRSDPDATLIRLEEMAAFVEDVLADDPSMGGLDGIVSAEVTATEMTAGRTNEGFLGFAKNEVRIHSRLT